MSHVYCPECGFQNQEAANYCSKCGALLHTQEGGVETTQTFSPEEGAEMLDALADISVQGPALVVRSGGGRSGETFAALDGVTTIGRSPDCPVFLDDVTVSRNHALVEREGDGWVIIDEGSLNGTYVNRRRGDRVALADGDEIQIGKYKLTFIVPS